MEDDERPRKYELTADAMEVDGRLLHRIRSLVRIEAAGVEPGDLGGWLESEANLSHDGDCWVADQAQVMGGALVCGDAIVKDQAIVRDRATVGPEGLLFDRVVIEDDAVVDAPIELRGTTTVFGSARIASGQDGPQVLEGVHIDFDVSWRHGFAVFGLADEAGLLVAVSRTGRVCVAPSWSRRRWSGSLDEFVGYGADGDDAEALGWIADLARSYVERFGHTADDSGAAGSSEAAGGSGASEAAGGSGAAGSSGVAGGSGAAGELHGGHE